MSTHWTPWQRRKNDAIVVVVRVALAIARVLPKRLVTLVCTSVSVLAWALFPRTRRLARENLARAGVSVSTLRIYRALGALLGDTVALLDPRERAGLRWADGALETLRRAHAARRGVVLITAHLGPWERLAATIVEAGFSLTTPVRASYDPRLDARVMGPLRRGRGVNAIDRDDIGTPRALLRTLREGSIAGFLVDLNTRVASIETHFFGRPAWTPTAPARLALRTGAPVVAAFATRDGIVVAELRAATPPTRGSDEEIRALTLAMTTAVERAVLCEPERWIWMHDRWGARRDVLRAPGSAAMLVAGADAGTNKTREPAGITDGLALDS